MPDQTVSFVLRRDADTPDSRIESIGEGKVDDAAFSTKIDRRFGAPVGQLHQPTASATGQDKRHGAAREVA
jgi:hypothetical protein